MNFLDARVDSSDAGGETDKPLTIQPASDHDAREGETYTADIDPTTVLLFHNRSEQRLL